MSAFLDAFPDKPVSELTQYLQLVNTIIIRSRYSNHKLLQAAPNLSRSCTISPLPYSVHMTDDGHCNGSSSIFL